MKVSLNWVKKYIDIPADLTNTQIAYDLTMRTVEVEDVVDTAEKFHDISILLMTLQLSLILETSMQSQDRTLLIL